MHKGEFRVTKSLQDTRLAHPISQSLLVHNNLVDPKVPTITLDLCMLSKGCFTGLEDYVFDNTHYSLNIECITTKGTIYIITGKKLEKLMSMKVIWHKIKEHTKKQVDHMQAKFNTILRSRAKYPYGKRFPTAADPESFIEFRRKQTK